MVTQQAGGHTTSTGKEAFKGLEPSTKCILSINARGDAHYIRNMEYEIFTLKQTEKPCLEPCLNKAPHSSYELELQCKQTACHKSS